MRSFARAAARDRRGRRATAAAAASTALSLAIGISAFALTVISCSDRDTAAYTAQPHGALLQAAAARGHAQGPGAAGGADVRGLGRGRLRRSPRALGARRRQRP